MLSLQKQIFWFRRLQWALVAAAVLLVAAFYLMVYMPQTRRLKDLQARIDQSRSELNGSQTKTSVLPGVVAEVTRLRERVGRFKTLSRPQELGNFLGDMEQFSRQASLKNLVIKEDINAATVRPGNRLSAKALDISFEGDFMSIYALLRQLEELPRLTRIPSLNIETRDRQGQVRVSMKMNIYFQAE